MLLKMTHITHNHLINDEFPNFNSELPNIFDTLDQIPQVTDETTAIVAYMRNTNAKCTEEHFA